MTPKYRTFAGWVVSAVLVSFFGLPALADLIFLNKGDEISGKAERITEDKVYLKTKEKIEAYDKKDIQKMKLVKEWRLEGEDAKSRIKDAALLDFLKNLPRKEDYPDDGYYIYLYEKTYVLKKDLSFSKTVRSTRCILRERGKDKAGNVKLYYLSGLQKAGINYARSITGEKVFYLDDTSVQDASEYFYYPPYDRLKSIKFSVPNVNIGSVVDFSHTVETSSGSGEAVPPNWRGSSYPFFGEMGFRTFEPMGTCRLNIFVPKGLKIRYFEFGLPKDATFKKKAVGDSVRYTWEVKNIKSYREEDLMPPYWRMAPRVSFCLEDDWRGIQNEFSRILKDNLRLSPELKKKVAGIVSSVPERGDGTRDPEDVVESLYNWVTKEIKYVNIDMDEYSFIPKTPAGIFQAKMGNRLDKPYLFYAMLREAGLDAVFVYLKDKYGPDFMESLPSIRQFSTGGVVVNVSGREMVVSPLYDTYRWNEIPGWLQGVSGLLLPEGSAAVPPSRRGDGLFFKTPLYDEDREMSSEKIQMEVDADGSARVDTVYRFAGQPQADRRGLKDLKNEELENWVERMVHGIHPNAVLTSFELANLDDLSRDIVFSLKFRIDDYALKAGDKFLAFRVPGLEYTAGAVGKPGRELPMFWYQRRKKTHRVTIRMPEGYKVYYLPKEIGLDEGAGSYRAGYSEAPFQGLAEGDEKRGVISFEDSMVRRATEISPGGYGKYKRFRENLAKFAEEWIVLTK